ncbi:IclR family transcriptional regulator [Wenjunlia tyrosinilytica]|uniref:Transcriptional regulator n=1 Tax=Wenjunlia tyrosinilytica TaxID=1544741 RepID=A0A917ZXK6_9ACTN|nr:IclR family transcriptional regulator [Wenjunlia tyrosinilytica]GGO97203.1 transcriptional regulator [Wenjunlia tyrosinilytica]
MTTDPARGVQTAMRALSILEAFSSAQPSLSLSEISEAVGLSVPTTHRLLKALRSRDMVILDPDTRRYSLGHGVMRMAKIIMSRDDLVVLAHPGLERLRSQTGETVSLQTRIGDQRVPIVELISEHPIRMASGVGATYSLLRGAAGKALLAFLPQRDIDRLVPTSTEPERLAKELVAIRAAGYATSRGEVVAGATAVAVPVLDSEGAARAVINVTGPADRFTAERMAAAVDAIREVAESITRQLGGAVADAGAN